MATYYVSTGGSDAAAGTSEGAAWQTINKAVTTATAGDLVNIKNDGTYTQTATLTPTNSGTATGGTVRYRGYTTTVGDGGRPLITTATNSTILFQMSGKNHIQFEDLEFSNTASTRAHGFSVASADSTNIVFIDCIFDGFSIAFAGDYVSFFTFFNLTLHNCEVKNCTGKSIQATSVYMTDTLVHAGGDIGLEQGNYNISTGMFWAVLNRCSFYNNAGDQVVWGRNYHLGMLATNCNFYPNASSRDCIDISNTTGRCVLIAENCIFYPGTSGYGINAGTVKPIVSMKNCAFGPTGTNYAANITAGTGEITLSGVPWTSAPSNWALDSTAGEGAACKAAGFPGALLVGGTGYIDLGPLQHQDAGSGSGIGVLVGGGIAR